MREIKFRVWDQGFMDYDVLVDSSGAWGIPDKAYNTPHREIEKYSDDAIIMQFTGLKDMHGKEIYEGDILEVFDKDWAAAEIQTKYWYVNYWKDRFILKHDRKDDEFDYKDLYTGYSRNNLVVIGNIHDNPELVTQ